MWLVDEDDWKLLEEIAADCSEQERAKLKAIMDKGEISRFDVDAIYELLPTSAPFHQFADRLRLKPREYERPAPSKEFQELTERLRFEQENRAYNQMISSVDSSQNYGQTSYMRDFGKEIKSVNRQIIAVINTLITVAGAFAFGFFGITFAYPSLELSFEIRMVIGLCLATVVFFADLYFIVKSMDADQPTTSDIHKKNLRASKGGFVLDTKEAAKRSTASADTTVGQELDAPLKAADDDKPKTRTVSDKSPEKKSNSSKRSAKKKDKSKPSTADDVKEPSEPVKKPTDESPEPPHHQAETVAPEETAIEDVNPRSPRIEDPPIAESGMTEIADEAPLPPQETVISSAVAADEPSTTADKPRARKRAKKID